MCFLRDLSAESALATLEESLPYRDWIVGVGLDSDEKGNPPVKFRDVFARARDEGYRLTMHCDVDQEDSVGHIWQCLDEIGVERIDHGVNSLEDPALVREIEAPRARPDRLPDLERLRRRRPQGARAEDDARPRDARDRQLGRSRLLPRLREREPGRRAGGGRDDARGGRSSSPGTRSRSPGSTRTSARSTSRGSTPTPRGSTLSLNPGVWRAGNPPRNMLVAAREGKSPRAATGPAASTREEKTLALTIGDTAPDFEAETSEGPIHFHDWLGDSWAVLFSHPKDFTPVCTTELGYMAKIKPEFDRRGVKIIGLSVDPAADHDRWAVGHRGDAGHEAELPDHRRRRLRDLEGLRDARSRRLGRPARPHRGRQPDGPQRLRDRARQEDQARARLPDDDRPQLRRGAARDRLAPAHREAPASRRR